MARLKQAHTVTARGKMVLVVLKNGLQFLDRFMEKKNSKIVFMGRVVSQGDIIRFSPASKEMRINYGL